ncbi:mitochondrial ribosomal protein L16 isoform X2 [Tachypleus tridentatus]|uniref:mitochondrial ribosomal protein L16 isoform X2 n=1 Tax=Tachypleus tridentatus TaxID=6853 RepID=UPI003FD53656
MCGIVSRFWSHVIVCGFDAKTLSARNTYDRCQHLITQVASMKLWSVPPSFKHIELPEKRKLPQLDRIPIIPSNIKPPKMTKRLIDIRGPELVHNQLIYKQYGIIALSGGNLRWNHIESMRLTINRKMDSKRTFAVWRIDSPWKPITRKGQGKRMGGGKGAIDHYVTPVKAGRVVVEIGGHIEFEEIEPVLKEIVNKLPFDAMPVSQKILDELLEEEQRIQRDNANPFSFEYVVKNKMQGCQNWISNYDNYWFGKYV